MCVRPIKSWKLVKSLGDPRPDDLFVTKSLIADSLSEQLVEIKLVLHQEVDAAGVELHYLFVHDRRVWENVKVEGPHYVFVLFGIPLKCCDTKLKGIHPLAVVLDLLVFVLNRVIVMLLVIKSDT
jgi:hypothetical protein